MNLLSQVQLEIEEDIDLEDFEEDGSSLTSTQEVENIRNQKAVPAFMGPNPFADAAKQQQQTLDQVLASEQGTAFPRSWESADSQAWNDPDQERLAFERYDREREYARTGQGPSARPVSAPPGENARTPVDNVRPGEPPSQRKSAGKET